MPRWESIHNVGYELFESFENTYFQFIASPRCCCSIKISKEKEQLCHCVVFFLYFCTKIDMFRIPDAGLCANQLGHTGNLNSVLHVLLFSNSDADSYSRNTLVANKLSLDVNRSSDLAWDSYSVTLSDSRWTQKRIKIDAAEPEKLSFFIPLILLLPCQILAPSTLPTMQRNCQQISQRFVCVMLVVAANVASSC